MSLRKIGFIILSFVVVFTSCKKDDGGDTVTIEIRDRAEQQISDNESIINYLETHYYNKSNFSGSNTNLNLSDIVITEITNETISSDADSLLINAVITKQAVYEDTDYQYYVLRLNDGGGINKPTFADNVVVTYEGFTLDDNVFDSRVNALGDNPFDLVSLIQGWRLVLPDFHTAESYSENGDGTVNFVNSGLGVMFLPSGLAYFSSSLPGESYAPLVFKFELIATFENDHDNDGVPSYLEDLYKSDGTPGSDAVFEVNLDDLTDETDDDTDGDGAPNYFDTDDDGDGIQTKDEIVITTENKTSVEELRSMPLEANQVLLNYISKETDGTFTGTIITFTDSDSDGIYDYLDKE
jgi:FKBP-type peptidyl-prolyl cis-trans isomerase